MRRIGEEISRDVAERNHRFLEEALELVQSTGCTASEAHQLVDYVFNRPTGETHQEIGGVMVTLAALCLALGEDMHAAAETELARIWTKVETIRAKQAAKPKHSPLPEHVSASPAATSAETQGGDGVRVHEACIAAVRDALAATNLDGFKDIYKDGVIDGFDSAIAALAAFAPSTSAATRGATLIDEHLTLGFIDDGNCCAGKLASPAPAVESARVKLPPLTETMIKAACKAHYGSEEIDGIAMTSKERDWNFRQAFKRMWSGVRASLATDAEG